MTNGDRFRALSNDEIVDSPYKYLQNAGTCRYCKISEKKCDTLSEKEREPFCRLSEIAFLETEEEIEND